MKTMVTILLICGMASAQNAPSTCGEGRWHVKTLSDYAAAQVLASTPQIATVTQLRAIPAPDKVPDEMPRQGAEMNSYAVRAQLLGYSLDSSQGLHLVIAEPADASKTMIAVIPGCYREPATAFDAQRHDKNRMQGLLAGWKSMRASLEGQFGKAPAGQMLWLKQGVPIDITGVFFFDTQGQTGAAPNAAELHPVLSLALIQ